MIDENVQLLDIRQHMGGERYAPHRLRQIEIDHRQTFGYTATHRQQA